MAVTLTATIEQVENVTSRATVRSHSVLVDRGVAKGGLDRGPAGGEYLLVALGGCFTSHLLAAINARQTPMSHVVVKVGGTMEGTPERFSAFTLDVTADTTDAEHARKMVLIAARACQVVNTLRPVTALTVTYDGSEIPLGAGNAAQLV